MGLAESKGNRQLLACYKRYGLVTGAAECEVIGGGVGDIDKYLLPPLSEAKKSLIKGIAAALADRLKIPRVDPRGKDLDQIVEALKKEIPDPRAGRGNGKTWTDKGEAQVKTCREIAKIINDLAGEVLVNPDDNAETVCERSAEFVYSLFAGTHAEFIAVKKDVERLLKNIRTLEEFMEQGYNVLIEKINTATETNLSTETAVIQEAHKDAMEEMARQRKMLENVLEVVIKPHEADLEDLAKENHEFKTLVSKIKRYPGTKEFGQKIAFLLGGLRTVAAAAKEVDKALNKAGMSLQDYAKLKEDKDLRKVLNQKTQEMLNAPESTLLDYERAKAALFRHQYMHDEIVEQLKRTSRKDGQGEEDAVEGGVEAVVGGLKLDKKVRKRQELKKSLLKTFNSRVGSLVEVINRSAKQVSNSVNAGQLNLSDDLDKFVRALDELPDMQKRYVYLAMSGYSDDIESKQDRERYVSQLKYLVATIDLVLGENPKVDAFKDMRMAFNELITVIDVFANKFAEGFGPYTASKGRGEEEVGGEEGGSIGSLVSSVSKLATPENLKKLQSAVKTGLSMAEKAREVLSSKAVQDAKATITGLVATGKDLLSTGKGAVASQASAVTGLLGKGEEDICAEDLGIEGGDEDGIIPSIARIGYNLDRSKDLIRYSFRTAKIKYNLNKNISDVKSYGEDYNRVLGDAIAGAVDRTLEEKNKWTKKNYTDRQHPLNRSKVADVPEPKLDQVVEFVAKEYDVKVNMYRLAEAVDLYMRAFTEGINSKPDDIRDLISILETTEVISHWFNDKSSLALCKVFESFPYDIDRTVLGVETIRMSHIGENMETGVLNKKHYYLAVAATTQMGNFRAINTAHNTLFPGANWAASVTPADNVTGHPLPGNPFMGIPIVRRDGDREDGKRPEVKDVVSLLEKAVNSSMLKNIVALFVNVGKKFGDSVLEKQTHLSPIQIYRHLLTYMTHGVLTFGMHRGAQNTAAEWQPHFRNDNYEKESFVTLRALIDDDYHNKHLRDIFQGDCDSLFIMIVKSIVAKVMTTLGVYNMFNKPINKNGLGFNSSLRTILGGAAPKVIPEALELYVRLPLLAEFYRELFKFDAVAPDFREISLIPEFDGVFSGLINLIFDKAQYIKTGEYSDLNVHNIIEEVNKIYNRFASSKNPVNDAVNEFVLEVNRRYGVIKAEERAKYLKEKRERFDSKYQGREDVTDFELEGLDENEVGFRPAPSMSFQTVGGPRTGSSGDHKYKLALGTDYAYVRALRNDLDKLFKDAQTPLNGEDLQTLQTKVSFNPMLLSSQEELKHAKSDEEKYEVVRDAINSLGQFSLSNLEKNLLLFHETVVYPLNNLKATHLALVGFEEKINGVYNGLTGLNNAINRITPATAAAANTQNLANLIQGGRYTHAVNVADNGRQGATANRTYANLTAVVQASWAVDTDKCKQLVKRFMLNQDLMLLDLEEIIFSHAAGFDGDVELKMDVKKGMGSDNTCTISCYLDHSKLFQRVNETFNSIKQNIDRFRGLLPKSVISKYENYGQGAGTVYGVERDLILTLIQGKRANPTGEFETLEKANSKIKEIFDFFTTKWTVNADHIINIAAATVDNYHQFTPILDKLVYFSDVRSTLGFDLVGGTALTLANLSGNDNLLRLLFNNDNNTKKGTVAGATWPDVPQNYVSRSIQPMNNNGGPNDYKTGILKNDNRNSLFVAFNRLVLNYLSNVFESNTGRVYTTTIDKFANGAFSSAVAGQDNFNNGAAPVDCNSVITNENNNGYKGVLLRTTGLILRQMLTEMDSKGLKKQYLETDLNEVPLFVKERMRANLPVLHTLFRMLITKAEILKHLSRGLNVERAAVPGGAAARTRSEHESDLVGMADQVIQGSVALNQCIKDTLNELANDSKYLETYQGFIANYESENGKTPYMPISSLANSLKNMDMLQVVANDTVTKPYLPEHNAGQTAFKLLYATRKILHVDEVKLDELPGMKELLKNHNQSADVRHELKEEDVAKLTDNVVHLARNLLNLRHYASVLNILNTDGNNRLNIANVCSHAFTEYNVAALVNTGVYQLQPSVKLETTLQLTESSSQKESKGKVLDHLEVSTPGACPKTKDRKNMLVYNIIDLNIVPINVHALMREIPLVNLYNYAFTFDHMIKEMYGLRDDIDAWNRERPLTVNDLTDTDADIENMRMNPARNLFGVLLQNPLRKIDPVVYEDYVSSIMRGNLGIPGLGRPKYLADDVYNTVLFGGLYNNLKNREEGGPASGHGNSRGVANLISNAGIPAVGIAAKDFAKNDILDRTVIKGRNMNDFNLSGLTYLAKENGVVEIKPVDLNNPRDTLSLIVLGSKRFDTVLIRYLFWLTNIQRTLRLKLRRDLDWYDTKVVKDLAVASPNITELYGNNINEGKMEDEI